MKRTHMIGVGVSAIAITLLLALSVNPPQRALASSPPAPELSLEEALASIGYTPEVLAAVDASSSQTTGVVAAMATFRAGNPGVFGEAKAEAGAAAADVGRLTQLVRSGQASASDITALTQARTTLATEDADVDQVIANARAAVELALTADQRATINTILASRDAYRSMPVFIAVDTWSETDWVEARTAWAAYCDEQAGGPACDANTAAVVDDLLARTAVDDARTAINASLGTVQAAWDRAIASLE